jgi:hypothetical protein
VYVGNLSYDVKYRDLIEFMRGGGWGRFSSWRLVFFFGCGRCGGGSSGGGSEEAESELGLSRAMGIGSREPVAVIREREGQGLDTADELWGFRRAIVRRRMFELIVGVISW